jgi:hypothetical protein
VLVHETERAIREHQPQIDFGMCGEECSCDGQHVQPAKDDWRSDQQVAKGTLKAATLERIAVAVEDFNESDYCL